MLENAGIKIGQAVVKQAATTWLDLRKAKVEQFSELSDLIKVGVKDISSQRKLSRKLEDVVDEIADRLNPLLQTEFQNLPQHERIAAMEAVVDALEEASLDDALLFNADVDSVKLARAVRKLVPFAPRRAGLSEQASVLFDRLLDESCICLVNIVYQLPAFQPRATAEILSRLSELTRMVHELPRASLSGNQDDVGFSHRYLGYISKKLDVLDLFGVDTRHYRARTSVSVAYLSLSVADEVKAVDEEEKDNPFHGEISTRSRRVENSLACKPRTLLHGEAGSGKTTLLQWIGVNAARGSFSGPLAEWNEKIPFLVRLRAHAIGDLPWPESMVHALAGPVSGDMPNGWATRIFRSGRALLLVDGVDELRVEQREKVPTWLSELQTAFNNLTIVVTSRPSAAGANLLIQQGFQSLSLEQMTSSDVAEFCRRWHIAIRESAQLGALLPCELDELGDYEKAVLRHIESRPHLRTLATTPMLCAMLCALNLDRRKQLPFSRMKLYEQALDLLLERRDAEREVPASQALALSTETKAAILQHLAWWLTLAKRSEMPRDLAVKMVGEAVCRMPEVTGSGDLILRYLLERSGVIREPIHGEIDFIHRTFQEYLAGKQAAEDHHIDFLIQNAHDDQWHETVVMAAGHASVPLRSKLLDGLLDRASKELYGSRRLKLVAAACLDTAHTVHPEVANRVDRLLAELLPPRSELEFSSLILAGQRVLSKLPHSLDSVTSEEAAVNYVRLASQSNHPNSLRVLSIYANDPRIAVQEALARAWKHHPPRRYAAEVLAGSPLIRGKVTVDRIEQIPHLDLLENLTEAAIQVHKDREVSDLRFIENASKVAELVVSATSSADLDLTPLAEHKKMRNLAITGNPNCISIHTLTALRELTSINIPLASTREIDVLATSTALQMLYITHCSDLAGLESLSTLPNLTALALWNAVGLSNIAPISKLPLVSRLAINQASRQIRADHLTDILPQLSSLNLYACRGINDLASLANSRLSILWLPHSPVEDLTALEGMTNLKNLTLAWTKVKNLQSLSQLYDLQRLDLCGLGSELDLSPLLKLPSLQVIWLSPGQNPEGLEAVSRRVVVRRAG